MIKTRKTQHMASGKRLIENWYSGSATKELCISLKSIPEGVYILSLRKGRDTYTSKIIIAT